jgi:hypothetical protein
MGAQGWVNAAQKYVAYANRGVAITQHRKDLEQRDSQIRVLTQQVESLQDEIMAMRTAAASDGREIAAIRELIAGQMGHPRRPMSTKPQFGVSYDEPRDFEQERVNYRSKIQEEVQPPRIRRPKPKSIMNVPPPGYDVQSERINQADAQRKRTRARL